MSSLTPQLEMPVVKVDQAHWQNAGTKGSEPLEYSINGQKGFILSTEGYTFVVPEEVGFTGPNMIQIIIGKDQLYAMAYEEGISEYHVEPGNLVAMYGSAAFEGFEHGQKVIAAIGHLTPATQENPQPKLILMWVGVINIL